MASEVTATVHRLSHLEIAIAAKVVAEQLAEEGFRLGRTLKVFPIPRGGVPALYAALAYVRKTVTIVSDPQVADVFVDDLVDSGHTRDSYLKHNPGARFLALFTKGPLLTKWLIFPWESSEEKSIEDAFTRLLQFIGEDANRGGLLETPARMAKAWRFWTSGYGKSASDILKTFEDGGENYDEMIHVKDIPFYSQCEHHLAPFFGTVTFAYIPDKRIVGLSKMSRLVEIFARRLQVQERLTVQIIEAFCNEMHPVGAAIKISARHLCMESRGICQQGSTTTTCALRGAFKEQPATRAEFFSL